MRRVDAAIIGVHKCGTTSLLRMLSQHPQLATHLSGQWPYFLASDDYRRRYEEVFETHFDVIDPHSKVLVRDASLAQHMQSLERFVELCPGALLIIMIREPIVRAYSAFCYSTYKGYDSTACFDDVLRNYPEAHSTGDYLVTNYIAMGFYYSMLQRIENVVDGNQILILQSEQLRENPVETCAKVFERLQLPPFDVERIETNKTAKVRSRELEVLLKQDSVAKRIAKSLLPLKIRLQIRQWLARWNEADQGVPPLREYQIQRLRTIYYEDSKLLRDEYGIDYLSRHAA